MRFLGVVPAIAVVLIHSASTPSAFAPSGTLFYGGSRGTLAAASSRIRHRVKSRTTNASHSEKRGAQTPVMRGARDPELEGMKVDTSNLDDSEKKRLSAVRTIQSKMAEAKAKSVELRTITPEGLTQQEDSEAPVGDDGMTPEERWRAEGAEYIEKCLAEVTDIQRQLGMDVSDIEQEREIMDTAWRGQATVDQAARGSKTWVDVINRPWLAGGDVIALTLFAYIGRASHGMPDLDFWVVITAVPFYLGWFAVSPLLGAYTESATSSFGDVVKSLVPTWGLSMPVAIALRGVFKGGEVPPVPFIATSMIFTFVALLSWRLLYTSVNPTGEGDKKATLLDVFKMVTMLVQRW